jgi:LacI family transcriptional regulator
MNVTIKKIADELQIAVSTVSKALRDSYEISAETKQKVLECAKRYDYTPNPYASSLKKRSTANIAVVLPEVADSFFSAAINGIESIAYEKKYHVVVYLTHDRKDREHSILHDLRSGRVDGVLMSVADGPGGSEHINDLANKGVPLVFFDRIIEDVRAAKVVTDDYDSGFKATEHLIKKGSKRLSFLSISKSLTILDLRLRGFLKAHEVYDLPVNNEMIVHCDDNDEVSNFQRIKKLLEQNQRPDGIVGSVEKVTTLAYTVCRHLNIKIPEDVRILGFSHLQIAALLDPPLTTITQPAFEMGKTAATILFKTLEKKIDSRNERIVLRSELVERASTR